MESDKERIERLEAAYRQLWKEHEELKNRIKSNYAEFNQLRESFGVPVHSEQVAETVQQMPSLANEQVEAPRIQPVIPKPKTSWEQFIGEQLLSKIGIAIVLIGVGIGAKYAIDHNWMNEGMRVMGGYLIAALLGFFAFRFRNKYRSFSAVLASGALAVSYFMTYAAAVFYHLIPDGVAFAGLLVCVIGTVWLSLYYNLVVIAHFGLIGAYVLPPLISNGDKHIAYYLTYMLLINAGMLSVSLLKSWKSIQYPIIAWTGLIFVFWFWNDYNRISDAWIAMAFLLVFTILFTLSIAGRAYWFKEELSSFQTLQLVSIAVSYFGTVNYCMSSLSAVSLYVSALVGGIIYLLFYLLANTKQNEQLKQVFIGLVVYAALITFCFQLETYFFLLAAYFGGMLLFWMPTKHSKEDLPRIFGIIVLSLSTLILLLYFVTVSPYQAYFKPFSNDLFLTGFTIVVVSAVLLFIADRQHVGGFSSDEKGLLSVLGVCILLATGVWQLYHYVHFTMYQEAESLHPKESYEGGEKYFFYNRWIAWKNLQLAWIGVGVLLTLFYRQYLLRLKDYLKDLYTYLLAGALVVALLGLSLNMHELYRFKEVDHQFWTFIQGKYLLFVCVALSAFILHRSTAGKPIEKAIWSIGALWILSLELVQWSVFFGFGAGYKLLLSLLWGVFAIGMIFSGIRKNIPVLRITAMIILGITLVKLFFYDLTTLSTIVKTVVFVLIGGLLLVGAYFYQQVAKQQDNNSEAS